MEGVASTDLLSAHELDAKLEIDRVLADIESGVEVDALAYIDDELKEGSTEKREVERLIAEEMAKFRPRDYIASEAASTFPAFKEGSLAEAEWKRFQDEENEESLLRDDEALFDAATRTPAVDAAISEWQDAVRRASIAIEYAKTKSLNAELLSKYGPSAMKMHLSDLEAAKQRLESARAETVRAVDGINRGRKRAAEISGPMLERLHRRYVDAVQDNARLEEACAAAEEEIRILRRKTCE